MSPFSVNWNDAYDLAFDIIGEAQDLNHSDGNGAEMLAAKYANLSQLPKRKQIGQRWEMREKDGVVECFQESELEHARKVAKAFDFRIVKVTTYKIEKKGKSKCNSKA